METSLELGSKQKAWELVVEGTAGKLESSGDLCSSVGKNSLCREEHCDPAVWETRRRTAAPLHRGEAAA